jgi:hypothetical protein
MPLPKGKLVHLSSTTDHATNGKIVHFYCYGTGQYESEKHTHDHEAYMRKCDADLIRLLASMYLSEMRKVANVSISKSVNYGEAIILLETATRAFSDKGDTTGTLKGFQPYSREILYQASDILVVALRELDPAPMLEVDVSVNQLYRNLMHLAEAALKRYELEVYAK